MSTKSYQQQQIEAAPERALLFLRAVATNQRIRYAMASVGYTDAEQAEGWQLLLAASGYAAPKPSHDADAAARQAIIELDDWDEAGYRRIHAALERLHPEQDTIVFAGLEANRGPSAVLGVAILLDRLDQLEAGSAEDRAAIATLQKRGITPSVRQHLRGLLSLAQTAKPAETPVVESVPSNQQALEALYAWHRDWSETARAIIRRRDHLILMGLAKRRTRKTDDAASEEPSSSPVVAAPVVTPEVGATAASPAPTTTP
ncbi:MAG: hypothetical protein JW940_35975 [Polyangiaceae bacterium]|nr:hypothetical protein [Polyangiaceae bacterium]